MSLWTTPIGTTAPVERMRITSAGNVGVGNTDPQSPLHITRSPVAGTWSAFGATVLLIENDGAAAINMLSADGSESRIDFGESTDLGRMNISANVINRTIMLTTAADTPREDIVIDVDGNVGIGTTSPGSALHVHRTSGESAIEVSSDDATVWLDAGHTGFAASRVMTSRPELRIQTESGNQNSITLQTNLQRFYTVNTERMRIGSDGNVGICTTNPPTMLGLGDGTNVAGITMDSLG